MTARHGKHGSLPNFTEKARRGVIRIRDAEEVSAPLAAGWKLGWAWTPTPRAPNPPPATILSDHLRHKPSKADSVSRGARGRRGDMCDDADGWNSTVTIARSPTSCSSASSKLAVSSTQWRCAPGHTLSHAASSPCVTRRRQREWKKTGVNLYIADEDNVADDSVATEAVVTTTPAPGTRVVSRCVMEFDGTDGTTLRQPYSTGIRHLYHQASPTVAQCTNTPDTDCGTTSSLPDVVPVL